MASRKHLVAALALFCISSAASVPFIKKCKAGDKKCGIESAQAVIPLFAAGLPDHHVKTLDPVTYKKIDASSQSLTLVLTDVTVTGLKDSIAEDIRHDPANNKLYVKLLCSAQLEGQYEMKGQLLILPIEGKGPLHVTLRKAEISLEVDLVVKEKDGVKYWDIKSYKHSYELKDKSDVVFENLFNGNEVLAQAAREVISSSGNEIIQEVGPKVIMTVVEDVVKNIKKFFHSVPANELEE